MGYVYTSTVVGETYVAQGCGGKTKTPSQLTEVPVDSAMSVGDAFLLTSLPLLIGGGLIVSTGEFSPVGIDGYMGGLTATQLHRYSCATVRSVV